MHLGNIITSSKYKFDKSFFVGTDFNLINESVPTLIVGWKIAKEYIGKDFSILNKKIGENIYWTFMKDERRGDFISDLSSFYKNTIDFYSKKISYKFLNIITSKYGRIKNVMKFLKSEDKKYVYIDEDRMIYILYNDKFSIGISLDDCEYFNLSKSKVIDFIFSNKNNIRCNCDIFSKNIISSIGDRKYIIPYLYKLMT